MRNVWLLNLPRVTYADALDLQHRLVAARKRGALGDALMLLEHPPVFTLGRNASDSNILAPPELLEQLGIDVFRVERGGDVTYHGPGQLVGYPILDLNRYRRDVGWYVRALEETLIRALADFGIEGKRVEKLVGVWTSPSPPHPPSPSPDSPNHERERGAPGGVGEAGEAKIAQIGARIEQWITYHGFALNVDPDLMHFDLIVPCGIADKAVTTMTRVLNRAIEMREVRARVAARFAEVLAVELVEVTREEVETKLREWQAA